MFCVLFSRIRCFQTNSGHVCTILVKKKKRSASAFKLWRWVLLFVWTTVLHECYIQHSCTFFIIYANISKQTYCNANAHSEICYLHNVLEESISGAIFSLAIYHNKPHRKYCNFIAIIEIAWISLSLCITLRLNLMRFSLY